MSNLTCFDNFEWLGKVSPQKEQKRGARAPARFSLVCVVMWRSTLSFVTELYSQ
jgi:hypothetical protein